MGPILVSYRRRAGGVEASWNASAEATAEAAGGATSGMAAVGKEGPHARSTGKVVPTLSFGHFRNKRGLENIGRVCYREEIHGGEEWMK